MAPRRGGQLEKGFAAYERVCAHPDQRLPVTKRELAEYMLPEALGMLDLSEAHARVTPRFAQGVDLCGAGERCCVGTPNEPFCAPANSPCECSN